MKNYITNKVLSILLFLQIFLVGIASRYPDWIEKYYSNSFYPLISRFLRRLIGWVPISIGDIFYGVILLIILRWIWHLIQTHISPFREHLYTFLAFLSVIFFVFNLFWGLNYYRNPLYKAMGLKNIEYSEQELLKTTESHIKKLNEIHLKITSNDSSAVVIPYKRRKIYKKASLQYQNFFLNNIDFSFKSKSIKSSLFSTNLSYMGYSGYLNPFTGEAQVNRKIPSTDLPVIACHEMAHQSGYASEGEANYIGYLACKNSDDLYFQFSGELLAVRHLLFTIAQYDRDLYKDEKEKLNIGIIKNIQITRDFWDSYKNPIEPYFKKFYDYFLKVQNQKEGIQSYNAMVGYLINEPQNPK